MRVPNTFHVYSFRDTEKEYTASPLLRYIPLKALKLWDSRSFSTILPIYIRNIANQNARFFRETTSLNTVYFFSYFNGFSD